MDKGYVFWHMEDEKFKPLWNEYKASEEEFLGNEFIAKLVYENIAIELEIEKEDNVLYTTFYTCRVFSDGWGTDHFFNDETERNIKVNTALDTLNWLALEKIMHDMLIGYCENKKIAIAT